MAEICRICGYEIGKCDMEAHRVALNNQFGPNYTFGDGLVETEFPDSSISPTVGEKSHKFDRLRGMVAVVKVREIVFKKNS